MTTNIEGLYQHHKGQFYKVLGVVKHSETLESLVLYEVQYENPLGKLWVRPYDMFFSKVWVNGIEVDRFRKVENQ